MVSIPPTIINYCSDTKITRKTIQFKNPLSHSFIVAPNNVQLLRYCPPERKAIIAARSACFSLFIPLFILVCSFAGSFWLKTQRAQLPARRHPIKPLIVYLAALVVGIYWDFSMCCFKVRYDGHFPRGGLSLKGNSSRRGEAAFVLCSGVGLNNRCSRNSVSCRDSEGMTFHEVVLPL